MGIPGAYAQFNTLGLYKGGKTIGRVGDKQDNDSTLMVVHPGFGPEASSDSSYLRMHPPLARIGVSSGRGWRTHLVTGGRAFHRGIDLKAHHEPVYPVMDGRVEATGYDTRTGLWVRIRHAGGLASSYTHLSRILVRKGVEVEAGRVIAVSGVTGMSMGPHLHFSFRVMGSGGN